MYYVNWYEAVEYCNKRSLREGLTPAYRGSGDNTICDFTASGYRLPTEAEWEYAAKGGGKDRFVFEYAGGDSPDSVAWYNDNSGSEVHPVGTKEPNSLGLYDMSGNVYEWCWDWFGAYTNAVETDPEGPSGSSSPASHRVSRGGSLFSDAQAVRSAARAYDAPSTRSFFLGFRVVRSRL
jgi:formylglycine-generating enzyme required for sulfatase activity